MLLFGNGDKQHLQSYNAQSKGRYFLLRKLLFKDYKKRLLRTTQHSSWVSDIMNPKIYINPGTRFIDYPVHNMPVND